MATELDLILNGLDGITIAYDYDAALAELDRGFKSEAPLTRTNDEIGAGCAMTPCVLREDTVKSHIVLNAAIVPLIDNPQNGVSGRYIIAHEAAHAHEHFIRDYVLPGTILRPAAGTVDEVFLYTIAEVCWVEYAASYFSARIYPDEVKLLEQTFNQCLSNARERIIDAKKTLL